LPVVEVTPEIVPPAYAAARWRADQELSGARHVSAIEGSQVKLNVSSLNKPLERVTLTVEGEETSLTAADESGMLWTLAGTESPLSQLSKRIEYEIQAVDRDGLQLQRPIRGRILIKNDQ